MSDRSAIEWLNGGATWNVTRGCSPVSAGCQNCYAARMALRFSGKGKAYEGLTRIGSPHWTGGVRLVPEALDLPIRWRKPRLIFPCSMSDLFHDDVPDDFLDRVFTVMARTPRHTFLVLTKRAERMRRYMEGCARGAGDVGGEFPWHNVWCGVSVEDQTAADKRIPDLLATPTAVRFLSCEPLLSAIDIDATAEIDDPRLPRLDWVIVGGESGPRARPMDPEWARSLRDQCVAAGVPFYFKAWGDAAVLGSGLRGHPRFEAGCRPGAKKGGRVLDGRTWDEIPEVSQ